MGTFRDFSVQKAITPAASAALINNTNTTNEESRAVYIGVDGDYKFYVDGSWITFAGINP